MKYKKCFRQKFYPTQKEYNRVTQNDNHSLVCSLFIAHRWRLISRYSYHTGTHVTHIHICTHWSETVEHTYNRKYCKRIKCSKWLFIVIPLKRIYIITFKRYVTLIMYTFLNKINIIMNKKFYEVLHWNSHLFESTSVPEWM